MLEEGPFVKSSVDTGVLVSLGGPRPGWGLPPAEVVGRSHQPTQLKSWPLHTSQCLRFSSCWVSNIPLTFSMCLMHSHSF